jgi:hypothetical protein
MCAFWVAVLAYVVVVLGNVSTQLKSAWIPSRRGEHRAFFWFGDRHLITLSRGIGPRCAHGGGIFFGCALRGYLPRTRRFCKSSGSGGVLMLTPDESDAMKKAWTYAVLDAVKAADENTRLEIARILCPAGFEIVEIEPTRAARNH